MSKAGNLRHLISGMENYIFNKDGSVYLSRHGYLMFQYAKANEGQFNGDEHQALTWAKTKLLTNPDAINSFGQHLYTTEREDFIKHTVMLVPPYDDSMKTYDPSSRHTFTIEWFDPLSENDHIDTCSFDMDADRVEVAIAVWGASANSDSAYDIHRITETHEDKVLNVWEARSPETQDYELVLIRY